MWDKSGKPIEESFNYLTQCLDWSAKYKLRTIVDLHIIRSHYFNAANEGGTNTLWTDTNAQNTFLKLWIEISHRLKKYPVNMVVGLLFGFLGIIHHWIQYVANTGYLSRFKSTT